MVYNNDSDLREDFENFDETGEFISSVTKGNNRLRLYLNFAKHHWLIILFGLLCGFAPAFLWAKTEPIIYPGNFELLVEPVTSTEKLTDPTTLTRTEGNIREELFAIDYPTILKILTSSNILEQISKDASEKIPQYSQAYILNSLNNSFSAQRAQQGKSRFDQTKVINISYNHENPELVMAVLETASHKFLEYSRQEREQNLESGVKFINEQIDKISERIKNSREKQEQLQTRNLLINPQEKGTSLFERNTELNKEINSLESQLKELKVLANNLQQDLGLTPSESLIASTLSQDPKRQQLLVDLQAIESQIAQRSAQLKENNPMIVNLEYQKDNLSNLLENETMRVLRENNIDPNVNPRVFAYQDASRLSLIQQLIETQNQIDTLSSRYQSMKNHQTQTQSELVVMPTVAKEYNELERQITLDTSLLDQLTKQKETLSVEITQKQIPWQILSPPQIPVNQFGQLKGYPPDPEKKLAAGILFGLALGILLAMILDKKRDIIYEINDLKYIFNLPILGIIKSKNKKEQRLLDSQDYYGQLPPDPISLSEVYTNLHFNLPSRNNTHILITSLEPRDKQAYIAFNLAKTAVRLGKTVLLVDTNTKSPEIHQFFATHHNLDFPNLLVLPSPDIPTVNEYGELQKPDETQDSSFFNLQQEYVEQLLNNASSQTSSPVMEIAEKYDFTIYNSSFFLESFNLSLLAQKTQGIILVVRLKHTPLSQLKEAIARIQSYDLNFLGFVVIQ